MVVAGRCKNLEPGMLAKVRDAATLKVRVPGSQSGKILGEALRCFSQGRMHED